MNSTLRKAYEKYFEILEDYFELHYKQMMDKKEDLTRAIYRASSFYDEKSAESVCNTLFQEMKGIDWNAVHKTIQQVKGTKALFRSPFLPTENLVKRASLYADTVIFSGLLPHITEFQEIYLKADSYGSQAAISPPKLRLSLAMHFGLQILHLKDFLLTDLDIPIVAIVSPLMIYDDNLVEKYCDINTRDALRLSSFVFGKKLSSHEEYEKYVRRQKNMKTLIKRIKKPEFFESYLPDKALEENLSKAIELEKSVHSHVHRDETELLVWVVTHFLWRKLGGSTNQLIDCSILDAEPTVSEIDEWRLLKWRFENDCEIFSKESGSVTSLDDLMILSALQMDNFRWLGNVPLHGIIKMREEGDLQDMREILSREIRNIKTVSDKDFVKVGTQVKYNLEEAFRRHRTQVKSLDEKFRKRYKFDVASLLVTGSLGAVSTLYPPLAMLTALIGGGSMINVVNDVLEKRSRRVELQKKPIGLLFQAYEDRAN